MKQFNLMAMECCANGGGYDAPKMYYIARNLVMLQEISIPLSIVFFIDFFIYIWSSFLMHPPRESI